MNPPETPTPQTNPPKQEWFSRLLTAVLLLNVILVSVAAIVGPFKLSDFQKKILMAGLFAEGLVIPVLCCWRRRWSWAALLVVVAVLNAIAFLPNFVKARTTRSKCSCSLNLKDIDGAVQQWARENKKAATDTYSLSDPQILRHLRGSVLPACPAGGHYSPGINVSDKPRCSFAASSFAAGGHAL